MSASKAKDLVRRFGVDLAAAEQAVAVYEKNDDLKFVIMGKSNTPYFGIERLGGGSYGEVYSASTDGSSKPSVVIKIFTKGEHNLRDVPDELVQQGYDYEYYLTNVEVEYLTKFVILRRIDIEFCENNVVCAYYRFYRDDFSRGYIVYPYSTSFNLQNYLRLFLHPRMRALAAQARAANWLQYDAISLAVLARMGRADSQRAAAALVELRSIQVVCINLARQLLYAVAYLHAAAIIHRDLNPSNMIVDNDTGQLRLIDFGLACVGSLREDPVYETREKFVLECPRKYETTFDYEDPIAERYVDVDPAERTALYAKFDVYSVGKILQVIFDETTIDSSGHRSYPVVHSTVFMPTGLLTLIQQMTGENDYRASLSKEHFDLSMADVAVRQRRLVNRPTAELALNVFIGIAEYWIAEEH